MKNIESVDAGGFSPVISKISKLTKPFHSLFVTDGDSLSTSCMKKIKFRKSNDFTSKDLESPPRSFLERALSCQDLSMEICEKWCNTLQRLSDDKETYFPAAMKATKSLRKQEGHRVYQVNQPLLSNNSNKAVTDSGRKEIKHKDVRTESTPESLIKTYDHVQNGDCE